jgi:branched-chain amino acid transport system substrate-binding protein
MKRLLVCFAAALIFAAGCDKPPFRIGFVGGLTGKMSDLGISGRNSLQLAVGEINAEGGMDGRPAELIVRDDKNDPEQAEKAVRELIDSGVDVIVGHMVSSMSLRTVPIVNEHHIVMISPTTSTPELSGKDDYFFRVIPENTGRIARLAAYCMDNYGVTSFAGIIDLENEEYTIRWWEYFTKKIAARGAEVLSEHRYGPSSDVDYAGIAEKAAQSNPDCIVLVTNAFDTAMFCQQIKKRKMQPLVIPCGWAMTEELIHYGGNSVEGLPFVNAVSPNLEHETYLRFQEAYTKRYGEEPDFAAINTYDAAMVIRQAYEEKKRDESLKAAITRIGTFAGLQDKVKIDTFGDTEKDYHILVIRDGAFVRLER